MPFFMNVYNQEFRGNLVLSDRQYSMGFVIPANKNSNEFSIAGNPEPYDLTTYDTLLIFVSVNSCFFTLSAIITGGSADSAQTVADRLNAISAFSQYFTADVTGKIGSQHVRLHLKNPRTDTKFFVYFSGANYILNFTKYAGIAEIPTYFRKYLIDTSSSNQNQFLLELDGTDTAPDGARAIIRNFLGNQSWTNSDLKADWELFGGKSGLFKFQKTTVDGDGRPSVVIEYSAGAVAGDLAKRITYTYNGTTGAVLNYTEEPYTLTSGDLISPV